MLFLKGLITSVLDITLNSVFVLFVLFMFSPKCFSNDVIIHSGDEVYYYQNLDQQENIILPNHEIIETDEIGEIIEEELEWDRIRTREGTEIYKGYDNQLFLDECEECNEK